MKSKVRREREVRTNPESRKESGKQMGNNVAQETGVCSGTNRSPEQNTPFQKN